MNFKIYLKLVLIFVIIFMLIEAAVVGGIIVSKKYVIQKPKVHISPPTEPSKIDSEKENKKLEENIINVLILAVDKNEHLTDVIMLAQYNKESGNVNILRIPRDTKIVTKRYDKKINSAYAFGSFPEVNAAVSNLLGINVDKDLLINIKGFRDLVDEIGGVKVNVPINMNYDDPVQGLYIHLNKGEQLLDGRKAEQFVRFRHNNDGTGYPNGDLGRINAQKQFIDAFIDKALTFNNVLKINRLIATVVKNFKMYNIKPMDIYNYKDAVLKFDKNKLNYHLLPGYADDINKISYYINDVKKTDELIKQYFIPHEEEAEDITKSNDTKDVINEQVEDNDTSQEKSSKYKPKWTNRFIKIEVLNGSDQDEAASKVTDYLKDSGFKVEKTGQFNGVNYNKTQIINRNSKGAGKEISKALSDIKVSDDIDKSAKVDVTIIVGNDYKNIISK